MEFEILTITYSKVISNTRILHIDTKRLLEVLAKKFISW